MNKTVLLLVAFTFFLTRAVAQNFENGFNFTLPYDDSTTVEFLPQFPQIPIDENSFISADNNGNFISGGKPIRFFGGNLTAQGAFPQKTDAAKIAGRMRKMGINLIRFHHIDNPWSDGSLFYGINGTRNFNDELLDRLDYLIYQLKQNGIFVNMNLNVSRTFEASDGVVAADSLTDYAKGITLFDRKMIELEKEYARKLLTHVNPYTGIPLAQDPAMAMIEIVNENSLFRRWYAGQLEPISVGGSLPAFYANELDSLWHNFLATKYNTTQELENAWNTNAAKGDTLFSDDFENGLNTQIWQIEQHEGAQATFELSQNEITGNHSVLVKTIKNGTASWHITFKNVGISVKKDRIYELHFRVKSDSVRKMSAGFQRNNSPWTYYSGSSFETDTEYKSFKVIFKAPEDNEGNLRIWFRFEYELGNFYIDDVVFKKVSIHGLKEDESFENKNIARVSIKDINGYTKQRVYDLTDFYAQVQIDFLNEMKTWLKDTLGVSAPLAGTNWYAGPEDTYVQNTLDYIDNHAYWDHPSFPEQPWSSTDWLINNVPMVNSSTATINKLFNGVIVQNKPMTVSEYNHAYPNQFQAEMLPIITSYLSFNGVDGIMFFTYSGSWDWDADRLNGYFDLHRNHTIMAGFPVYSYVFRNRLINEAQNTNVVNLTKKDILSMPYEVGEWWYAHSPFPDELFYNNKVELTFNENEPSGLTNIPKPSENPYATNNGEIFWDENGVFKINTPAFTSITGELAQFAGAETDKMKINNASDFGAISWLSLVDSALENASKSLLFIGSKQINTGMHWDGINTVHNNWGTSPTLIAPLELNISLKNNSEGFKIYPLDVKGNPIATKVKYAFTEENGFSNVTLDPSVDKTLWYGLEAVADWSTTDIQKPTKNGLEILCFPNPSRETVHFINRNSSDIFNLKIFNLAGKQVFSGKNKNTYSTSSKKIGTGVFIFKAVSDKKAQTGRFILNN